MSAGNPTFPHAPNAGAGTPETGCAVSGAGAARKAAPVPTGAMGELTREQRDKLRKSVNRLLIRHGWWAFAEALAQVCQEGANCWHADPEPAALWQHRADTARQLAEREERAQ